MGTKCFCVFGPQDKKTIPQLPLSNNLNNNQNFIRQFQNSLNNSNKIQQQQQKRRTQKFNHHKRLITQINSKDITQIGNLLFQFVTKQLQNFIDFTNNDQSQKFEQKIVQTLQLVRDEIIQQHNLVNSIVETVDRVKEIKQYITKQKSQNSYPQMPYQIQLFKPTYQIFNQTLSLILTEVAFQPMHILNLWRRQGYTCRHKIKHKMKQQQRRYFQNDEKLQCQICLMQIQKSFKAPLQACRHIFHLDCIRNHINTNINSNIIKIRCPSQQCQSYLTVNDLETFLDNDTMEKYYKFTLNKYVQSNSSMTSWCPTAGCSAVFQYDEELDDYDCPVCRKHYCLKCRTEYHNGMTCQQFRMSKSSKENDRKFLEFVKGANFKQCPNCKYWVEKKQGCPSIRCKCGIQFCYGCGGTTCPHGSCSKNKK